MELQIQSAGKAKGSVKVADAVYGQEFNESLVHQVVTAYLANARQASSSQKTRSQVSGGGRKPWKQKGTGRARVGSIRSPLWRTGGVIFAKQSDVNYQQKLNKKMYRAAMRCILSELVRQERLIVVEALEIKAAKTKLLVEWIKPFGCEGSLLLIDEAINQEVYLAARNVPRLNVIDVKAIEPVSLVGFDHVILTKAAAQKIEEQLV